MKRVPTVLGLGALLSVLGVFAVVALAGDKPPEPPGNHVPVTICHATNSETNPYVIESPDNDSIIKAGHGDHTGPIFEPGMKADKVKWGDVIPAFSWWELVNDNGEKTWVEMFYPGMNGGDVSRCITEQPPEDIEVTATAPTFQDPTCDLDARADVPTVEGVTYTVVGTVAPGQTVTVKATADEGYVLVGTDEWTHTFGLVPDNCTPPPEPSIEVTPGVAFQDPTCDVGAAVIPTTTTGLTYAIAGNVAPGEHVKVTATANDGYTIKGSNTWEHTFGLVPSNCVVQETTTEPTPTQPLTPPTRPTKPAEKTAKQPPEKTAPAKAPAKAKPKPPKPAPLTPPTKAVAGAQKTAGAEPELAYTP